MSVVQVLLASTAEICQQNRGAQTSYQRHDTGGHNKFHNNEIKANKFHLHSFPKKHNFVTLLVKNKK